MKLTVPVQQLAFPNTHGLIYTKEELEKAIENCEFPMKGYTFESLDNKDASHVIEALSIEGDYLVAKLVTLDTPAGRQLERQLQKPTRFGISGSCNLDADGSTIKDLQITSVSVVED